MSRLSSAAVLVVLLAVALLESDLLSWVRVSLLDALLLPAPPTLSRFDRECSRLAGPVGAEDGVLLDGDPPVVLMGELDALSHEFTTADVHGASASTIPPGRIWALEMTAQPRLTPLEVPLPAGATTMHLHGLGLHGDVLFAVNHAFGSGGERIERWRVSRPTAKDGADPGTAGHPVALSALPPVTAALFRDVPSEPGERATLTSKLNAAINDIAPVSPTEWYMTQFVDEPASHEGAAAGLLPDRVPPPPDGPLAAAARALSRYLGAEIAAKLLLPRLRRSRLWHCYCDGGLEPHRAGPATCRETACTAVGRRGVVWNGVAYRPVRPRSPARGGLGGRLYVSDIFRRVVVEYDVLGSGASARLEERRSLLAPHLIDNLHLEPAGGALWAGAVGYSSAHFWRPLAALLANASAAHAAARAASRPSPRPHTLLRPEEGGPPTPPMPSGALRFDLATGEAKVVGMQGRHLAGVSFSIPVGDRLVMGSPFDDGVLVCPRVEP